MDLTSLTHWQQLSFCAAICERSLPNFQLFCELEEKPEQSKQARKILNKVWEFLRGQLSSMKNIEKQLEVLNDLVPDPTQHEGYGAYPAMDAMVALQSCIQGILDDSINDADVMQIMTHERLLEVLELQDIKQDDSELWARQISFEQDVYTLITEKGSHADAIKKLIPLSHDKGVSQLGIYLDD